MNNIKRFKQIFENNEDKSEKIFDEFEWNKTVYIPQLKTIVGAYMVIGETEKQIEILNIKEYEHKYHGWLSKGDHVAYTIYPEKVKLPKSQIKILNIIEGKEGFNWVEIPYWLFKKQNGKLNIQRLDKPKRLSINKNQSFSKYLLPWNDENIIKYFNNVIKYDELDGERFDSYRNHFNE